VWDIDGDGKHKSKNKKGDIDVDSKDNSKNKEVIKDHLHSAAGALEQKEIRREFITDVCEVSYS